MVIIINLNHLGISFLNVIANIEKNSAFSPTTDAGIQSIKNY